MSESRPGTKEWLKEHIDRVLFECSERQMSRPLPSWTIELCPRGVNVRGEIHDEETFIEWLNS